MATLVQIIGMLDEQRRSLLDQLDAVDRAIAALNAATPPEPAASAVSSTNLSSTNLPSSKVMPRRVLTDAHKQALLVGRRKARNVKDVAKGHAREMLGESFVPAIGTKSDGQAPRLVKQPIRSTPGR